VIKREKKNVRAIKGLGTWPITVEGKKRTLIPQNRFEVLSSRVMKCGVEIGRQEDKRKEEEVI